MKRFYHLLALLFLFVGTAAADSFSPVSGTKYLIKNYGNSNFATYNSSYTNDNSVYLLDAQTTPGVSDALKSLFYIYTVSVNDSTYYTIQVANESSSSTTGLFVYSISNLSDDADNTIGLKSLNNATFDGTTNRECLWNIRSNSNGFYITPRDLDVGYWNVRGNGIGYWGPSSQWIGSSTATGNTWNFITPADQLSLLPSLSGYYTISCAAPVSSSNATLRAASIYNDFTHKGNSVDVTLQNQTAVGTANNYIWYVSTTIDEDNLKKVITLSNGQGSPLTVSNEGKCHSSAVTSHKTLTLLSYSNGVYWFAEGINASNEGYKLSDGTFHLTTWTNGGTAADNGWSFNQVTATDFYAVTVTGCDDGYAISGSEYAKNGGFITAPTDGESVTAATVEGYKSEVAVSTDNKTVTITYTEKTAAEKYADLYANVALLLADADNVGYPTSTSNVYTALAAFKENASATDDDVAKLKAAISAYKTTTDVVLPEDGHVYQIIAKYYTGEELPLYWSSDLSRFAVNINGTYTDAQTRGSYFFCHKTRGGYLLVNKDGRYLCYFDDGSYKSPTTSNYTSANNDCVLSRAILQTSSGETNWGNGKESVTLADLYGLLSIVQGGHYLTPRLSDGAFVGAESHVYYDIADPLRTHAYKFVDVSDKITLLSEIPAKRTYATFSSPFPVTLPASLGLTAYTATESGYTYNAGDGSTAGSIQMTKLGTDGADVVIPENTGILLYNANGSAVAAQNLVPAESADEAEIATTGLVATGADDDTADRTLDTDSYSYYVLGSVDNGATTGFYPLGAPQFYAFKAFLVLTKNSVNSIKLVLDDSTTSIDAATLESESNAPVYDLTGRRVVKATRGLYIQNGKKFIAR